MVQQADVVIIGGGVIGCSILYHLAVEGMARSVLLEREVLGGGSTGRSQAICRTHYSNPITASLAWESLQTFADFESVVGGPSGFVNTGYLAIVGAEDRAGMEQNVAMQQALGIATSMVDREEAKDLAPMLELDHGEAMAWEGRSGHADPFLVTTTYATQARRLGAEIAMRSPVTGVEVVGGRVRAVRTAQGRVDTPVAVVAAGPWAGQVLAEAGAPLTLETVRHQVATITRPPDRIPWHPIVGDIAQRFSFRPDGQALTLAGFGEDQAAVDGYNQGVDMTEVPSVIERLARRMPPMADSYCRGGWSGLFTTTPDWHPVLGRVPGIEGLYCAVGFSGHGFKLSPAIGKAMAELITRGESTSFDLTPLRFSRFEEGDLMSSRYRYRVLA